MSDVVDIRTAFDPAGLVQTPTRQNVSHILDDCWVNRKLGVIIGSVGCGKTSALKAFVSDEGHRDAMVLLTLNPAYKAPTPAINALRDRVRSLPSMGRRNISSVRSSLRAHHALADLVEDLNDRATWDISVLIVIDEAQYASPDTLNVCRALFDEGICGLVIAGNDSLFNAKRGRMVTADFSPLLSRAQHVLQISKPTTGDVDAVLDAYRIKGDHSRDLLHARAEHGGLREVVAIITKAREMSGTALVGYKHIKAAAATTGLSAFNIGTRRR